MSHLARGIGPVKLLSNSYDTMQTETSPALKVTCFRDCSIRLHVYHPDHRYVSQLVFDSYFQKRLPPIPKQFQPACRFGGTQVYYLDTIAGIGFVTSR